jgi:hypothetical protein
MSVPAFDTMVLAMLILKVEAPKGDGWSLGSSQVSSALPLVLSCIAT